MLSPDLSGRSISPCCLSAEKSRARFFAPLRCAQNDSTADESTDVTLSSWRARRFCWRDQDDTHPVRNPAPGLLSATRPLTRRIKSYKYELVTILNGGNLVWNSSMSRKLRGSWA